MAQGIIKKFGSALGWEDENSTGDEGGERSGPVLLTRPQFKLALFTPREFSDLKDIADALLNKSGVVISFEKVDTNLRRRIIDYMNGAGYAVGAHVEKITEQSVIYTPENAVIENERPVTVRNKKWF